MSLGKTEKKHKRDFGEDECDLSNAVAPATSSDTGLSMGSFSSGLASAGSYLEELLGEQELVEDRKKQEQPNSGQTDGLSGAALSPSQGNNISSDLSLNQSIELPPTVLDRLVEFICSTLDDLEEKLFGKQDNKTEQDGEEQTEEELFEEELKRLAYLKELQSKALRLQKILQARELARKGNYSASESLDELSDQELDAMIAEMKLVEEWLVRNGRLTNPEAFR
jgi:hypothetical protein